VSQNENSSNNHLFPYRSEEEMLCNKTPEDILQLKDKYQIRFLSTNRQTICDLLSSMISNLTLPICTFYGKHSPYSVLLDQRGLKWCIMGFTKGNTASYFFIYECISCGCQLSIMREGKQSSGVTPTNHDFWSTSFFRPTIIKTCEPVGNLIKSAVLRLG
jgi:hypothetical protein